MDQKGPPPRPLRRAPGCISVQRELVWLIRAGVLSLGAGQLTFVVATEFLTLSGGGKFLMFPLHNGAMKPQRVCVFMCPRVLEGGSECTHDLYEGGKAGMLAREREA